MTEIPKIKRSKNSKHSGWSQAASQAVNVAATFGAETFVFSLIVICTLVAIAAGGGYAAVVAGIAFACAYIFWQEHRSRARFVQEYSLEQLRLAREAQVMIDNHATTDEKDELDIFEQGIILSNQTGGKLKK